MWTRIRVVQTLNRSDKPLIINNALRLFVIRRRRHIGPCFSLRSDGVVKGLEKVNVWHVEKLRAIVYKSVKTPTSLFMNFSPKIVNNFLILQKLMYSYCESRPINTNYCHASEQFRRRYLEQQWPKKRPLKITIWQGHIGRSRGTVDNSWGRFVTKDSLCRRTRLPVPKNGAIDTSQSRR